MTSHLFSVGPVGSAGPVNLFTGNRFFSGVAMLSPASKLVSATGACYELF